MVVLKEYCGGMCDCIGRRREYRIVDRTNESSESC